MGELLMWLYERVHHTLTNDTLNFNFPNCYCGHGDGLNNPSLDNIQDVGPLPADDYDMIAIVASPQTGPHTIILKAHTPNPRDGFRIHGDNKEEDFSASHGCIILPGGFNRQAVWDSGDHLLRVI